MAQRSGFSTEDVLEFLSNDFDGLEETVTPGSDDEFEYSSEDETGNFIHYNAY